MLQRHAAGANVRVFDQILDRKELNALIAQTDCYISLHRSEGFGLTLAEAMNLGKPVIATGYSGNMEFMTAANSFPVKYQMVQLDADHGDYPAQSFWAQPDIEHAAEIMRLVHRQRDLAAAVAARGQEEVRQHLGAATVGKLISDRLQALANFGHLERRSGGGLQAGAKEFIPPHVRVAVLCEPDDQLIHLDRGRRAFRFPHRANYTLTEIQSMDAPQLIALLEIDRQLGARYLVVPAGSFPSLQAKPAFSTYLHREHRLLFEGKDCAIFELSGRSDVLHVGEERVNERPEQNHGVRYVDGHWISDGADRHLLFQLDAPRFVTAIRFVYSFLPRSTASAHAAVSHVFWCHSGANNFDESRSTSLKQRLAAEAQSRLVVVNDMIDQIRFDPDLRPAVIDLIEVSIIFPLPQPGGSS